MVEIWAWLSLKTRDEGDFHLRVSAIWALFLVLALGAAWGVRVLGLPDVRVFGLPNLQYEAVEDLSILAAVLCSVRSGISLSRFLGTRIWGFPEMIDSGKGLVGEESLAEAIQKIEGK